MAGDAAADRAASMEPMRRNPSTVVVLAGSAPGEVLAAVGQSMNVTLIRPEDPADGDSDAIAVAAAALQRAGRTTSPYALVLADPLAAVAAGWQAMWDVSRQEGPAEFELEAAKALAAWRAGQFELPDYYLVLAADTGATAAAGGGGGAGARAVGGGGPAAGGGAGERGPDFYLGPLRSARPNRVAFVAATEPPAQAAGVLHALGSLRHGPWWPGLDDVIEKARGFYPDSLAEPNAILGAATSGRPLPSPRAGRSMIVDRYYPRGGGNDPRSQSRLARTPTFRCISS
jgi:hypothetical protein